MRLGISDAVKHLIIINVVMFIGTVAIGNGEAFYSWFAMYFPKNEMFQPWQIFTHMFMHADVSHIFFNMFMLFIIGTFVESILGTKKFIFLYISAGLGAVLLSLLVDYIQFNLALNELISSGFSQSQIYETLSSGRFTYNKQWESILTPRRLQSLVLNYGQYGVGASGAIMGILAALGLLIPNRQMQLLFPPIRLKVKYLVVGMIGSDLICALLTGSPLLGNSNTNYMAHVGGAITGFIIMYFWKKNEKDKYRWN